MIFLHGFDWFRNLGQSHTLFESSAYIKSCQRHAYYCRQVLSNWHQCRVKSCIFYREMLKVQNESFIILQKQHEMGDGD